MKSAKKLMGLLLSLVMVFSLLGGSMVYAEEAGSPADASAPAMETHSYEVSGFNGTRWSRGEKAKLKITVVNGNHAAAPVSSVSARIAGPGFQSISASASADNGVFVFDFGRVNYFGDTDQLNVQLTFPDTSYPMQTVTYTIGQCDTRPAPEPQPELPPEQPQPEEPAPSKTPNLIVRESGFGGTEVMAGQEFTLTLTIFSTTGSEGLTDVLVGLSLPKDVTLASGNLNNYVGNMGPEATRTITYQILPGVNFIDGVANIGVTMSGIGAQSGQTVSADTAISVPVILPERFEITNMEAPETMMLGEEGYLSVTYVNKGKGSINNLSAEIVGENLANPGQSQFMGNVEPGTENSVDFSVMAAEEGVMQGKVILTYEDARGEVKTLEQEFSCTVEPMMEMDPSMGFPGGDMPDMEEPERAGMPVWGWLLIAAGAAAVIVAVVRVRKKKKAAALAQLEAEDEDL